MAPFFELRHRTPVAIKNLPKITKVVCGFRHNLAITEDGRLFGWGFNSMQ
jgi:alpha-tubulin suppressor-like RCC1 family protein